MYVVCAQSMYGACDGWDMWGCEYVGEGGPVRRQARADQGGGSRGTGKGVGGGRGQQEKGRGKLLSTRPLEPSQNIRVV